MRGANSDKIPELWNATCYSNPFSEVVNDDTLRGLLVQNECQVKSGFRPSILQLATLEAPKIVLSGRMGQLKSLLRFGRMRIDSY